MIIFLTITELCYLTFIMALEVTFLSIQARTYLNQKFVLFTSAVKNKVPLNVKKLSDLETTLNSQGKPQGHYQISSEKYTDLTFL